MALWWNMKKPPTNLVGGECGTCVLALDNNLMVRGGRVPVLRSGCRASESVEGGRVNHPAFRVCSMDLNRKNDKSFHVVVTDFAVAAPAHRRRFLR